MKDFQKKKTHAQYDNLLIFFFISEIFLIYNNHILKKE